MPNHKGMKTHHIAFYYIYRWHQMDKQVSHTLVEHSAFTKQVDQLHMQGKRGNLPTCLATVGSSLQKLTETWGMYP